jgi:glucose-6-phosphate isomerase
MASTAKGRPKQIKVKPLTSLAAWKQLKSHAKEMAGVHLRELFAGDPQRGERMTAEGAGLFLDYSKNRIKDETLRILLALAEESKLREHTEAMFSGEKINITEKRAVLHVALRAPKGQSIIVDGEDVVPKVHQVLDRMAAFCDRVRSGEWQGFTGKPIRNVVNIGIGGTATLQQARFDVPVCFECGQHGFCRGGAGS